MPNRGHAKKLNIYINLLYLSAFIIAVSLIGLGIHLLTAYEKHNGISSTFPVGIFIFLLIALFLSFYLIKNILRLVSDVLARHNVMELSEQRYRSILENASDAIYIADNTGNFIDLNESMCKMLGYSKDELMQLNFSEIVDPENLKAVPIERPAIPNKSIFKERTLLTRDGKKVEVEINGQRISENSLMGVARDITERKQGEESIRESEARFRGAFENAAIGVALVSLKGDWLQVNRTLCGMLGYQENELLKLTFQLITHPDDLANDLDFQRQMMSRKTDYYRIDKRYLRKDGAIVWANLNVSLVRDENKQPLYFLAAIENITEKVESQLKFQNLVENFNVGVYIHQYGKIVYVNPRILEETGYAEEDVLGMPYERFIHQDDLEVVKKVTEERENGQIDTARYEARFVKKDGQIIWFEILGSRTLYQGAPAFMGTLINVTERKAVHDELKKSEASLRSIFETTEVNYMLLDTNYDIVAVNQQAKDWQMKVAGGIFEKGVNVINTLSAERREPAKTLYDNVVRTNQSLDYETSYLKDGVYTHFLANVKPIHDGKKVIGICITGIDITARKNSLEKLEAAYEELQKKTTELAIHVKATEEQNQKLREIAWVQSHTVRAPLARIMGLIDLFANHSDAEEERNLLVNHLIDSANELDKVIADISDMVQD